MTDDQPPAVEDRPLHIGDHVIDAESDDETPQRLLVVGLPLQRGATYAIDAERTVADVNPSYPPEEPVVEVIFPSRTDAFTKEAKRYAFPAARLERVAPIHHVEEDQDDG